MMAFLLNPWVICVLVVGIMVGNLMNLKYTANMTFVPKNKQLDEMIAKDRMSQIDQLIEMDKQRQSQES
uniref:DUF2897 family protein n=1 Tax=Thaumasiovibrio occultus TaxID=1891184 RepID=UPI0018655074|nr:DUF2897 family protein [Thaumasiovibrio occultus]